MDRQGALAAGGGGWGRGHKVKSASRRFLVGTFVSLNRLRVSLCGFYI